MNVKKALSTRIPYYHPDVPFVVAWAQKAGCTSVFKWFLFHAGLLEEALEFRTDVADIDIHVYERTVFKARTGYKKELREVLESGLPVINFLRCPYQRAFSSYLQIHNRGYIRQVRDGVSSSGLKVRKKVLEFVYGRDVCIEYPFSFLEYLQWLRQQDPEKVNRHHSPQASEIYQHAGIRHFKLEDFAAATREVESEFGLGSSGDSGALFTSEHHLAKAELPKVVALNLLQRGIPINFSPNFQLPRVSAELLQQTELGDLIETIFAEDLRIYRTL